MELQGAFTALITPFRDGEVDEKALRDLVERQIAAGIDGLVPCGTTGESVTLRGDEPARVMRTVVEQARGRVPVIGGAGTNATDKTIALAAVAREAGVDGLLLVCPYYNKPTQAGMEAHFRAVLKEVPVPTVLYNVPGRTGSDLSADTVERLTDLPEVVGIKEATGNVLRSQEIARRCGDRLAILSGDDGLTLGILAVGGTGVISVTSNVAPKEVADVCRLWREGKAAEARKLHQRLLPLHDALFIEANPGPIKLAMAEVGLAAPEIRLPMVLPSEPSREVIRAALKQAGVAS
ncbi:MAG: 4-hydroxy-tetrahydrodipicolinate synthase [Myxococcota bacterium]